MLVPARMNNGRLTLPRRLRSVSLKGTFRKRDTEKPTLCPDAIIMKKRKLIRARENNISVRKVMLLPADFEKRKIVRSDGL